MLSTLAAVLLCCTRSYLLDKTDKQETSDFDRFQIQLAKRSRRDQIGRAYTKEKKAAK
jgi:hypothetical protein